MVGILMRTPVADTSAAQPEQAVVLRRTATGWSVSGMSAADASADPGPDQTSADQVDSLIEGMVLADLLIAERTGTPPSPPARPGRRTDPGSTAGASAGTTAEAAGDQGEVAALRTTITQLEHALTARVTIEQAIGVLAERTRTRPREAFERLRKVARSHGRKVHDVAVAVVASTTDPGVNLPGDLPGRSS